MSLAVTAVLAGGGYPRAVQVSVTGLTAGVAFSVTAATPDGFAWTVRGGNGQPAAAATAVLADISTPLGSAITYTAAQTGWSPVASSPVTVPFTGRYVLQSLDGRTAIPFLWRDTDDQRDTAMRTVAFDVPGRTTPVIRWDASAGDSAEISAHMDHTASEALRVQLRTAGPVMVLRTDGLVRDIDPVQYVILTRVTRALFGAANGYGTDRIWSLAYLVLADPEPSVVLAASNWDDFDSAYAAVTWAAFDTEWATSNWDDFDKTDWSTH